VIDKDPCGGESESEAGFESSEPLDDNICAHGVDRPERTPTKGWVAETENGTDVAITRRTQDPFLETPSGFVEERKRQPLLDLCSCNR
jgi:hypothetical protein